MFPLLSLAVLQGVAFGLGAQASGQDQFTPEHLAHEVVTFDSKAVAGASSPLSRQLLGLSIEFCWITGYLGDVNKPNELSHRLLQNIQDISGLPPRIRVGGDTQDVAQYCQDCPETLNNTFSDQNEIAVFANTEAANVTFNKNLFRVLDENVPSGQEYTFGLNFGQYNLTHTLAEFTAAETYMNLSRLTAYELGNEPDFYAAYRQFRPPTWNFFDYAQQTTSYLNQLKASLSRQQTSHFPGYMYGSLANPPDSQGNFSLGSLIKLGVPEAVKDIKIFSHHYYFGDVCTPEDAEKVSLPVLMNHLKTKEAVAMFAPSIAAAKSTGSLFFMGETNSAACHGLEGVSNTLGAALWMLDYSLIGATAGMDGLYFHNGVGFPYSTWQPVEVNGTAAHANSLYFGFLLVADLVSNLGPSPQIAPISSLDASNLAHYAVYASSGNLQKLVILNLNYVNSTSPRTYMSFDVNSKFGREVTVKRLSGIASNATQDLTWAGQTVDGNGNIVGKQDIERVTNGIVSVGSSEAVIIEKS